MHFYHFILFFLVNLIIEVCICAEEASFYGSSYISLPFEEAKSSTDIHFQFKTRLSSALILLVAGSLDYCIVRLENNRLKLNINLGAGESELISQQNFKLDDFKWHEVSIIRRESNLTMIIDRTYKLQKRLRGKFFELNIQYGLFIGGHGNFSEVFFGHLDYYRGCLSQLEYNGVLVLEQARSRKSQAIVHEVTWKCTTEFEAAVDSPITFLEDDAYMLIPQATQYKEFNVKFEIKTIISQGVLFYNSGRSSTDYLLIELHNDNIRLTIQIGDKKLIYFNTQSVSDGHWHKISVFVSTSTVEIYVDGKQKRDKNEIGNAFQLFTTSYIGGLDLNKRSRAVVKGCQFCDISFRGCIQNLTVEKRRVGLPDVHASKGLLPGCMWQFPCIKNPCKDGSKCIQKGLDSFVCKCDEEVCIDSNYLDGYTVFSQNTHAVDLELLTVGTLNVLEGHNAIITTDNLYMILDYLKYGINDSGVIFHKTEGPSHGSLEIDVWPHKQNTFSLQHIAQDKIHYIHDGSENFRDNIVLEVEFVSSQSFILPIYLQSKYQFSLPVTIVPVNDPPILNIPSTTVLRIVQGTTTVIDPELLKVEDPDSSSDQLIFNILESQAGHFEIQGKSEKITSFTQKDLDNLKIVFIHNTQVKFNSSYISLQASDGIEASAITKLRVSISPQYWHLDNNTGIAVLHHTSTIITNYNLSFVTNVPSEDLTLQYYVVKQPVFGIIELEKGVNKWEISDIFSNTDIKQHRVRYRHNNDLPEFDEFQFKTSFNKSASYFFRITFIKCKLTTVMLNKLNMSEIWESPITVNNLNLQASPVNSVTNALNYVIIRPPKYGYLFSSVSKYHLKSCDVFTQEDIKAENIKYRLFHKSYSIVEDNFKFVVFSPGCGNHTEQFNITYHPSQESLSQVDIKINNLKVKEGASGAIDLNLINFNVNFISDLTFNVTEKPRHGILQLNENNIVNNTDFFTLSHLKRGELRYVHDDSETTKDSFTFLALAINQQNFQYVHTMQIEIQLKNDNSPIRSVDKIFNVVNGGEKIITSNDLKFIDPDKDSFPSNILYTCRDSPNGNFYKTTNRNAKIFEFTQEDIDNNLILFVHKGPEVGKVRLWVTDGEFHVNGILEVQASAPFIHIITKEKLIVEQGKSAIISNKNLMYSTNVFGSDKDVYYEIILNPTFGRIVSSKNFKSVRNFTQEDINEGRISYITEVLTANADEIGFRVKCKDAINMGHLNVLLLHSSYWKPLLIKSSNALLVEESTSALISKNILEVTQDYVPPSSIVYYVIGMPENGYLTILSKSFDNESLITTFTQNEINENFLLYIQSGTNRTEDQITFNITNGVVWLNNVTINIEIIPDLLFLGSRNVTVKQGETAVISNKHLFVVTKFYKSKVTDYVIMQNSQHGCIETYKTCNKVHGFSQKEFSGGVVRYKNDGSEHSWDEVTIVAVAGNKRSIPANLYINILPVNNHMPKLQNNTGLVMWEGGNAVITKSNLSVVDEDRPIENYTYKVIGCWWGSITLINDTTQLLFFTQDLIDRNMVMFRHKNGSETKFIFTVSDGLHVTQEYSFQIKTNPVQIRTFNKPLHIFPLQRKYITSSYLNSIASDCDRTIYYEIQKHPSLGRLMMESTTTGLYELINNITQKDINETKVFYEHTHQFSDLYVNDSFIFNVMAHHAPTLFNQVFKIDISVSSGELDAYVSIPKISVEEGGVTNIPLNLSLVVSFLENHAGIRSPIIHASVIAPEHGKVYLQDNKNTTIFTQKQLELGEVYYEHDHSDSLSDVIYISLYLLPGYVTLCNVTVPITVNPINDQPFKLVTPAPTIKVVQGENCTITRHELATEDEDTPPTHIKYDVISGPQQGKLVLLPKSIPIIYFSQDDIDNSRLVYIHNGSVLKDSFHFRVWDENFRPAFTVFNIIVLPMKFKVTSGAPLHLQQGSEVTLLSEKQFTIQTNSDKNKIHYYVKEKPKNGVIYVRDKPSEQFLHSELLNSDVMYLQRDMTTANDSFVVVCELRSAGKTVGIDVKVKMVVQPLIQIRNFTVFIGERNKLTLHVLDATPLVKMTNNNPRFTIIRVPKFIKLRKIIRSSGENRNIFDSVVTSFTHEEVQSGLIYVEVDNIQVPWNGVNDYVVFILAASIFQPAICELRVNIKSSLYNDLHSTLAGPNDPASHEGGTYYASPNMTRDYFLIVSIVVGVVVLGVAVTILIKCWSMDMKELNKEEQCSQTMPLPRPPDRLMAPSPPLKTPLDNLISSTPTALPQCKITPLSRDEVDSHTCYPYGVEEHADEWGSCEVSDQSRSNKNIMLRRNQYWV